MKYTPNVNVAPDRVGKLLSDRVLYSFGIPPDGTNPRAALINVGGTLYGTTVVGGGYTGEYGTFGTVFSVTTSGKEKVRYSFHDGSYDGENPEAALIDVNGTLYGTTDGGGPDGFLGGTVFSITPGGTEKMLYAFGKQPDGGNPYAGLIDAKGTLYGTTDRGGANGCTPYGGCGTVFSITTGGAEKVLHSFDDNGTDGDFPEASVIDVHGKLYGTTSGGGAYAQRTSPSGGGVIFSLTMRGKEKVLHSFGNGTDGLAPAAGLIDVNGTLYGTTRLGGGSSCKYGGCGTLFSITTGGMEKVLYRFIALTKKNSGCYPQANLIDVNGTLYGTTSSCGEYGGGTIFSITTDGKETLVHNFGKGKDGWRPYAGLINVAGTLYGTTLGGGKYCGGSCGNGTVFALTP